jgi:amino acid transporter
MTAQPLAPLAPAVADQTLKPNAVGLGGILMQAVTHIGPGIGLLGSLAFVSSFVGVAAPLVYFVAFLIILSMGISLVQLARHLPSAGGFYGYVSHTVGPRAGFLTSWAYFLYDPIAGPVTVAFAGFLVQISFKSEFNLDVPWWTVYLVITGLITVVTFLGIELSARTTIVLGFLEMAIMVLLGISGLFSPGSGGINFLPFDPSKIPVGANFFLAVVFTIGTFTGFEAVAPLAEESKNPRRLLPIAIIASILLVGAYYLFTPWAIMVGWGTNDPTGLVNSGSNALFTLGHRVWGAGWLLVLFAVLNSAMACGVAAQNAVCRVYFAMARAGSFPKWFAYIHPKYRTPWNALIFQTIALNLIFGLGVAFLIGADGEFFYGGVQLTLGLIWVYITANLGVFLYYRTEQRRNEFNFLLHVALPAVASIALILVAYNSVFPLPAQGSPSWWAIVIAPAWMVIGVILVLFIKKTRAESQIMAMEKADQELREAKLYHGQQG